MNVYVHQVELRHRNFLLAALQMVVVYVRRVIALEKRFDNFIDTMYYSDKTTIFTYPTYGHGSEFTMNEMFMPGP